MGSSTMGVKLKAKYKKAQQAISGTINRMRASISEKLSRRQSLSDFHVADGAKQKRDKSQSKKIVISEPVKLETEMCQLGMDKLHIRNWDKFSRPQSSLDRVQCRSISLTSTSSTIT